MRIETTNGSGIILFLFYRLLPARMVEERGHSPPFGAAGRSEWITLSAILIASFHSQLEETPAGFKRSNECITRSANLTPLAHTILASLRWRCKINGRHFNLPPPARPATGRGPLPQSRSIRTDKSCRQD